MEPVYTVLKCLNENTFYPLLANEICRHQLISLKAIITIHSLYDQNLNQT